VNICQGKEKFPVNGRLNVLAKLKIIDYLHGAMRLQQPTGLACEENIRLSCEQKVQTLFSLSLSVNNQVHFFKPST
jgi:hypothetical protein